MPVTPARSSAGDFESFFRSVAPSLRRYLGRHAPVDDVDDLVAETFAAVWRRWEDAPRPLDERRAYTFGIARNCLRQRARSARRQAVGYDADGFVGVVPDHADDVAGTDRVARLLRVLPPSEREAMELTVLVGLSPREAARVLGCSATALSTRLTRARVRLGAALQAEVDAREGGSHVEA